MRPTVYIRVDGNSEIGLGHIIRCSALACMLRNYFNIIFFIQSAPNEIITKLKDLGFACNFIETEDDFINRVDSDKIIVLDGYGFNTKYMLRIKARNAKLIVIDDLHDKEYYADLIINTVPGVEQKDYLSKPNTKFALGPDFALLRPAFLEKALKERQLLSIDSVLICFGGSDSKNITQRILQIILEFQHFKRIIIVTGHSYTFLHSLKQLTSTDPRIELYYGLAEEQLASLMSESGIAIVPSSGVLYETIACGCIPISGTYVENQKHVYKSMLENGYIIDCGDFSNDKIRLAISLLSSQKVNQQKIIDGKSGRRILIKIFESLTSIRIKVTSIKTAEKVKSLH